MGINLPGQPRQQQTRQQIGPAIHELRIRRRWSLAELAKRAGISRSHLSRLESGGSVPSYLVLARLAAALEVSIDYFIAFERTSHELDDELSGLLARVGVATDTWNDFSRLGLEARGELIDALRRLTAARHDPTPPEHALELALLSDGVSASLARIGEGIVRFGLSPVNFMRASVQLEELPGERLVLGDREMLVPRSSRVDLLHAFRLIFGADLPDPMLLKWWSRTLQSARERTLSGGETRAIFPWSWISSLLRTGRWGRRLTVEPEVASRQVRQMIEHLRRFPRYRIGLIETPPPIGLLVKGEYGAIAYQFPANRPAAGGEAGVALRFSGPELAGRFRDYFDEVWDTIPADFKESEAVISRLESSLAASRQAH